MCLAIPMKLAARTEHDGSADLSGVARSVSLRLCPEAEVGDWILVHAGYAIAVIDEEDARETLALLEDWIDLNTGADA